MNSSKFILREQTARLSAYLFVSLFLHLSLLAVAVQSPPTVVGSSNQDIGFISRSASSFKPVTQPPTTQPQPAKRNSLANPRTVPARQTQVAQPLRHETAKVSPQTSSAKESPVRPVTTRQKPVQQSVTLPEKLEAEGLSPMNSSELIKWREAPDTSQMSPGGGGEYAGPNPDSGQYQEALPQYDLNPLPEYPEVARRRGYEGNVDFEVQVLVDGRVGDIEMISSSGHRSLDAAARKAVRLWTFQPATLLGSPVESRVVVPVRFVLGAE